MSLFPQTQTIADSILFTALQADTVEEGLDCIYALAIAWADQASLDAVFAFNETRLDAQRTDFSRQQIPARDYLRHWSVARLRGELIHALNQRLMEGSFQPRPEPFSTGSRPAMTKTDIAAYGLSLASSLSIEQALAFFENLVVRYASLVDHKKVREQTGCTEEDVFREVFSLLYFHVVEPISANGVWPEASAARYGNPPIPTPKAPPPDPVPHASRPAPQPYTPYYESDSPEQVYARHRSPEVIRAYTEAGCALVHYRVVYQHGMFAAAGGGTVPGLSGLLNDFAALSLAGDPAHWMQPVPRDEQSLRATCLLLLAGTAAPAILTGVHIDPLADTSVKGQAIRRMLDDSFEPDAADNSVPLAVMHLYEAAEKEVRAYWSAVERVAKRLLEVGEMTKEEAYRIFQETGRG